jgi:hypothetical protein
MWWSLRRGRWFEESFLLRIRAKFVPSVRIRLASDLPSSDLAQDHMTSLKSLNPSRLTLAFSARANASMHERCKESSPLYRHCLELKNTTALQADFIWSYNINWATSCTPSPPEYLNRDWDDPAIRDSNNLLRGCCNHCEAALFKIHSQETKHLPGKKCFNLPETGDHV